jgi:hypothetical protein
MTPKTLDVYVHLFSYSGSGSVPSCAPSTYQWLLKVMPQMKDDPRIGKVHFDDVADTPITAVRNQAVMKARSVGADVLLMVDADCYPDYRLDRDPSAKPFFDTSFDFLYKHYDRGPVVIGAPYCGPPPGECVYVFKWTTRESDTPDPGTRLEMYDRETAATMTGIQHCAALPTGLIMFDMRAFELTEPKKKQEGLVDRLMAPVENQLSDGISLSLEQMREYTQRCLDAKQNAEQSWFYYEWTDQYQSEKASTEDVTATRDIASHGLLELGYNPLRCNWDAWAGHWKVKCVDKPICLSSDDVNAKLLRAATSGKPRNLRRVELGAELL